MSWVGGNWVISAGPGLPEDVKKKPLDGGWSVYGLGLDVCCILLSYAAETDGGADLVYLWQSRVYVASLGSEAEAALLEATQPASKTAGGHPEFPFTSLQTFRNYTHIYIYIVRGYNQLSGPTKPSLFLDGQFRYFEWLLITDQRSSCGVVLNGYEFCQFLWPFKLIVNSEGNLSKEVGSYRHL